MFTTLAATLILSCSMPPHHIARPPEKVTCEGSDQVRRNHDGLEISRVVNACTTVRCEGADQVRRTHEGFQVSRALNACTVARCEGWDFVVRTNDGQALTRVSSARRCVPPSAQPAPQNDALQYGLSYR